MALPFTSLALLDKSFLSLCLFPHLCNRVNSSTIPFVAVRPPEVRHLAHTEGAVIFCYPCHSD